MTERTCSIEACGRKHVARGYCSSHYNKHIQGEAKRHPHVVVECVVCAATVTRRKDSRYQPTCSVACRTIVQWGPHQAQTSPYEWQLDAVSRATKHGCRIVDKFDRVEIFDRDEWICQHCGIQCDEPSPYNTRAATVDHVVPLVLLGDHSRANAQTLCLSCNSRKSAAHPVAA